MIEIHSEVIKDNSQITANDYAKIKSQRSKIKKLNKNFQLLPALPIRTQLTVLPRIIVSDGLVCKIASFSSQQFICLQHFQFFGNHFANPFLLYYNIIQKKNFSKFIKTVISKKKKNR